MANLLLNTSAKIPAFGLGTWQSKPGEVGAAVEVALKAGYRHIDCAHIYGNEAEIGETLQKCFREGVVKREEVFVTSKLWNADHASEDVEPACKLTLKNLQLEYLDLYLVHSPSSLAKSTVQLTEDCMLGYDPARMAKTWKTSGIQYNITGPGMVFSDQYSPLSDDLSWFGLHKVASGSSFGSYIAGPILAALVLSLWISAQRYQDHYYQTDHIVLGPHDKGALFLGVTYQNAEESLVQACKYLTNHFFEMYGLETCWSMLAIAVAIRIDVYGIFYALVLGLLMVVPRRPRKVLLVLWTSYLVLHGLLLGVQYAFLLGVPQGVCLSPGTNRDYPWRNMTSPLKKWLFLTQSNQQILDKNLLCG